MAGAAATALLASPSRFGFVTERLVLERHIIRIPTLPRDFAGYRVGFLTDLHLGICTSTDFVADCIERVLTDGVDLLLLGGDYVWVPEVGFHHAGLAVRSPEFAGLGSPAAAALAFSTLATLLRGRRVPDGILGVYGNHDRWSHPTALGAEFGAAGIPLLANAAALVRRGSSHLRIIGVEDYLTAVPELPPFPSGAFTNGAFTNGEGTVSILVSHNPDFVSELLAAGPLPAALALCGHTHGGQIRLPAGGPLVANVHDRRFVEGMVEVPGGVVYTSRGIGVVEIPYRICCPPEATIFTLETA